jgi:hypothetical protein
MILFDDDNATPIARWELTDAAGGGIVATVGSPARRAKSSI